MTTITIILSILLVAYMISTMYFFHRYLQTNKYNQKLMNDINEIENLFDELKWQLEQAQTINEEDE